MENQNGKPILLQKTNDLKSKPAHETIALFKKKGWVHAHPFKLTTSFRREVIRKRALITKYTLATKIVKSIDLSCTRDLAS